MLRTAFSRPLVGLRTFFTHSTHSKRPSLNITEPLNYVGGRQTAPRDALASFQVQDPATGDVICTCPGSGQVDIDKAVEVARQAFVGWSETPGVERARILTSAAKKLRERIEIVSEMESRDCGKPIWEARVDIEAAADSFTYMAGHAATTSGVGQHVRLPGGSFAMVCREPIGVCAAIGVWNFPLLTVPGRRVQRSPAADTMVYKTVAAHSAHRVIVAEIFEDAGCEGRLQRRAGAGDTETCFAVIKMSRRCPSQAVLLLASSGRAIVHKYTIRIEKVCSNATRVYVQSSIMEQFVTKLIRETEGLKIGDPLEEDTRIGATISQKQLDKVVAFVGRAIEEGAKVETGGKRFVPTDPHLENGFYFSPTIMTNCRDTMQIVNEEIFGAVVTILPFETEEEVVTRANNTRLGLAGGVFTRDVQRAHRVANRLQAGGICINNYNIYPPEVPFGGHKMSGIGRENGYAVIDHYTQLKTIYVEMNNVESPFTG
ncbi:PREDICTED: aldehyde dehydrogenase family 9 member A1-A-like [Priapulus caudatus]|uniref:Aldehyde dehydrogenase family 9 member A1-A-like n=1 Tax=Priapulus caudatus TaxID=37621 RepID=A0ABM1EUK4_PRICU|nr:PREDICTED: aldehyde dehydrogenase family 9 member A1-A-like [Priapulus caudatus]